MDNLKKKGILLGAHIPIGPSSLVLEQSELAAFKGLSDSMLDAAELARGNKEAGLRTSGNLPWDRLALMMPQNDKMTDKTPPADTFPRRQRVRHRR